MASFHMCIKSGKRGKATEHARYIAREGKHEKKKGEDLIAAESGNLPNWTNGNPIAFWEAADKFERINGAAYREYELALPAELTPDQNVGLVRAFVERVIGQKPYQFAIHAPFASLGGVLQPHAHVMCSDRLPDGIDRQPDQHFKRYNSKNPQHGGCRKDSGGRAPSVIKEQLIATRSTWAEMQNSALESNGHTARVDSRSHKARGIDRQPERHLGQFGIVRMTEEERERLMLQRGTCR